MRAARRRLQESSPQGATPLLNLSLFLMLLAFFIVLNSVSSFDESKYRPIIENLQTTFSTSLKAIDTAPSVTPALEQSINEGETIDRIEALFNAQITGFTAEKSGSRGIMVVDVPLEEFDRAMTTAGQIDLTQTQRTGSLQTYFMPTLISLLRAPAQGAAYRMDMILHSRDNPALLYNSDPRALEAVQETAGGYAALLEQSGLAPALLGIGIKQGDPAFVTLYFRPIGEAP